MKVAILQRVCTSYRIPLFQQLSNDQDIDFNLFIGRDVPKSKVKNASDLNGINITRLKSIFIKLRGHFFPIHTNLIKKLYEYKPDVIICEGESNFFGYLQAIFYKSLFSRNTKLVHWCFIALPGEDLSKKQIVGSFKAFFRNFFDAFLVYSSYSKMRLFQIGDVPENKIFVATNVGNIEDNIKKADSINGSKDYFRKKIGIREVFTVLYLGTLDLNKRPNLLLEVASKENAKDLNFLILGSGDLLNDLRNYANKVGLKNVYLPGRINDNLEYYFKASDVLVIPGRGGIVISEAMAYSIPVIVNDCDGTEFDLIKNGENGFHLKIGDVNDFYKSIKFLSDNQDICANMGNVGREIVEVLYNTENMIKQIKSMLEFVAIKKI